MRYIDNALIPSLARRWTPVLLAAVIGACGGSEEASEPSSDALSSAAPGQELEAASTVIDDALFTADDIGGASVGAQVVASGQCSGGVPGWRRPAHWSFAVTKVDRGLVKVKLTVTQPRNQPHYADWRVQMDQRAFSGATRTIYRNVIRPTGNPLSFTKGPRRVSLARGPNTFSFSALTSRESCSGSVVF